MDGTPAQNGNNAAGTNPDGSERTRLDQLPRQAQLAGWGTPLSQHANGTPEDFLARKRKSMANGSASMGVCLSDLNMQVQAWTTPDGANPTGTSAGTESTGAFQLNPLFSLWLMVGATWCRAWHDAGLSALLSFTAQATPSSRKSPRSSSKPTSKP